MKDSIICLAFLLILAACSRHDEVRQARSDVELGRKMVGTWSFDTFGGLATGTITVEPGGHYVCEIRGVGSNGVRRVELEGTQQVRNGTLVDTIIRDSQTNAAPVPRTSHAQIIRFDDSELVLKYEGTDRDAVLRRQKQ